MEYRVARLLALVFALLPACGSLPLAAQSAPQTQGTAATDAAQWRGDLAAWRAHREHELAAPDGPLTLVGLEWLKPGINSVGAAPDNQIRLRAQAPDHLGLLTVGGKPPGRSAHNSRDDHGSKSAEGSNIVQLLAPPPASRPASPSTATRPARVRSPRTAPSPRSSPGI